jgi:NADPH-dependent ferric siderophore reductase
VASAWAARAQAGDCVGVWGPGCATAQNIDWYLFAGDQTALPAISFIMENLPRSAQGQAFIEILDESERQVLNKPSGIEIQWLYSRGSTSILQDAVKSAAWPSDSRVFVWAGAERTAARSIRSYMRKNHKLDSSQMYILNYWRRGASEGEFGYVE